MNVLEFLGATAVAAFLLGIMEACKWLDRALLGMATKERTE